MTDICLLLEGTYPYVAGGVSTWVYDLIRNLKDVTFSIIYLGAHRPGTKKMHYPIPDNVLNFQEYYLFDYSLKAEKKVFRNRSDFQTIGEFLKRMKKGDGSLLEKVVRIVSGQGTSSVSLYDLIYSYEAWDMMRDVYGSELKEPSFIDYFWSWRFIYLPFFSLLRAPLLPARVYHTVSTGYAGMLGVLCQRQFNRPLVLTEHGIYTRERKIEIARADWIYSETTKDIVVGEETEFFKEWWINLFSFFSLMTYKSADEIITLYEGNRIVEIEEGADPHKTRIIPNGIDFQALNVLPRPPRGKKFKVGFMGRVVPIKDVKTFIRACKIIYDELKEVEFFIMGPTDEDEEYYQECCLLTAMESLSKVVHFTGKIDVKAYYPQLDVLVLTSISEAQPIVILEALSCEVPVVASDVGCCEELLYGRGPDDKLLGKCGIVTPLFNPLATAQGVTRILECPAMATQMGRIGKERVKQYYQIDDVLANYQKLYIHYMEEVRW